MIQANENKEDMGLRFWEKLLPHPDRLTSIKWSK